ncbi:uncharacterized protein LOC111314715 [Durio zibethinus]|uniref:Uncharacterized protein LOC111314715 n=1 Tax=Durio zibethinus TaxID=66656 RepID=A0A6P6B4M8_DURZI|nr:uncharacterized protein LOC111314715 [Durio zibethinus]
MTQRQTGGRDCVERYTAKSSNRNSTGAIGEVPILLAKPQTYMNFSGESVSPHAFFFPPFSPQFYVAGLGHAYQVRVSLHSYVLLKNLLTFWLAKKRCLYYFITWLEMRCQSVCS